MKEISKDNVIRDKLSHAQTSPLRTYLDLTVGNNATMAYFIKYEMPTFLYGSISGRLGFRCARNYTQAFSEKPDGD